MAPKTITSNDENLKVDILKLSKCTVFDDHNLPHLIYDLWQPQTTIFIFLRHFGCLMCRAHATQVWALREKYETSGAKLIFIGNGSPFLINKFKEDLGLVGAAIYTDPTLASFKACGFRRGFLVSLGPRALVNGIKVAMQGYRQAKTDGDLWQVGGIVVIRPNGKVVYHYISEVAGDYPPEGDALNSL